MATNGNKGVLIIYTGGTIGSRPKDYDEKAKKVLDWDSPQVVVSWEELRAATPELERLQNRGFGPIDCVSFATPLDSCNVGPQEWAEMARHIAVSYEQYEGFVILHGTDSMVYSASALSFILKNLGKPVILTGSQKSAMVDVRNDATQNFITALTFANPKFSGVPVVPEVCICFGGKLLRGNRSIKRDTSGYEAYESPNLIPLGEAGDNLGVNEKLIRPVPSGAFRAAARLDTNVTTIIIYPGVQNTDIVRRQLLETPNLKAAIILAYGTGNIPTNPEFLDIFREARGRGIILVNVSQCRRGPVELGIYETSALLLEAGFISAHDITLEAALCKLMILLGDAGRTTEEVEAEFQANEAGEQSLSLYVTPFPAARKIELPANSHYEIPSRPVAGTFEAQRIDRVLLRFKKAHLATAKKGDKVALRVFANLDYPEQAGDSHIGYAGTFNKWPEAGAGLIILDVTRAAKPAITKPGERISFTVFVDTPGASFKWEEVELALYVREYGD